MPWRRGRTKARGARKEQKKITKAKGTYLDVGIAVKRLHRSILAGVGDVPVVDGVLGDQTKGRLADPLPEGNIFTHCCRLQLRFLLEVEDLEGATGLQGNDMTRPVHDGGVRLDRPPGDIVVVLQVDDNDIGRARFVFLVSDADEGI